MSIRRLCTFIKVAEEGELYSSRECCFCDACDRQPADETS